MDKVILTNAIEDLKKSPEFTHISEILKQISLEVPCEECTGRGYLTATGAKRYPCIACDNSGKKYNGV